MIQSASLPLRPIEEEFQGVLPMLKSLAKRGGGRFEDALSECYYLFTKVYYAYQNRTPATSFSTFIYGFVNYGLMDWRRNFARKQRIFEDSPGELPEPTRSSDKHWALQLSEDAKTVFDMIVSTPKDLQTAFSRGHHCYPRMPLYRYLRGMGWKQARSYKV